MKIVQAIRVKQQDNEFFVGIINPRDLVEISFTDVRRIKERDVEKYLGIQRPLDENRVKIIKQYIQSPDATFPTGIVLAVDANCAIYDDLSGTLQLTPYHYSDNDNSEDIPVGKIAKVLDGQHRIAAFTTKDGMFDEFLDIKEFDLNIVVFVGIDISEQANIFASINLSQTKVSRSLGYDLEGLSKIRSPFKTAHQTAVTLDSATDRSPLYHRIKRLGVKTKGRVVSEPLTQAVFVESLISFISSNAFDDRTQALKGKEIPLASDAELVKFPFRNLFLLKKDNDIALIIFNYFSAIAQKWPNAWNDLKTSGNILPKSNAFKAFMRFLKPLYLSLVKRHEIGRIVEQEEFFKHFDQYDILDTDFTVENFKPGSAGESALYKILTGYWSLQDLQSK